MQVTTDSPVTRTFTHGPLPVGRVEIRPGLTFVHSSDPGAGHVPASPTPHRSPSGYLAQQTAGGR